MQKRSTATSIDGHFTGFPPETRNVLEELRALRRASAPDATEKMSYANSGPARARRARCSSRLVSPCPRT